MKADETILVNLDVRPGPLLRAVLEALHKSEARPFAEWLTLETPSAFDTQATDDAAAAFTAARVGQADARIREGADGRFSPLVSLPGSPNAWGCTPTDIDSAIAFVTRHMRRLLENAGTREAG